MSWIARLAPLLFLVPRLAAGQSLVLARLTPEARNAFDVYIRGVEAKVEDRLNGRRSFLWADESPERRADLLRGEVLIQQVPASMQPAGGLIHDWIGAVFLRGASLPGVLRLVQDYDNHRSVYRPEVTGSRLLSRNGNDYKVLLRLRKKKVITVVLNTEHDVRYTPAGQTRWVSRSYSTRIAEVEKAGSADERELPAGHDHGFLWRLYSYWRFDERDGGVYVECEAVSLTRDVPAGLGWLILPIVRDLPKESLEQTLRATRAAVAQAGGRTAAKE